MHLAHALVHHAAEHLGKPVIGPGEHAEDRRHAHDHVEVADHEVRIVEVKIERRLARKMPLIPPVTNSETKPRANSIAVVKRILPPQSVPSQLNVLMAEGTPMRHREIENAMAEYGLMPLMNM